MAAVTSCENAQKGVFDPPTSLEKRKHVPFGSDLGWCNNNLSHNTNVVVPCETSIIAEQDAVLFVI